MKYWHPVREVVYFKRKVYLRALKELAPLIYPGGVPRRSNNNYRRQYQR